MMSQDLLRELRLFPAAVGQMVRYMYEFYSPTVPDGYSYS